MNKDWRVRLLANVADSLIASFFHDESTNTILMSASTCAARPCASCSICSTLWELWSRDERRPGETLLRRHEARLGSHETRRDHSVRSGQVCQEVPGRWPAATAAASAAGAALQHDWHRRLTGTEVAGHHHPVETRHRPHTRTLFRWRPARRAQRFSKRVRWCSSTRARSGADRSSFPASRYNAAVM